MPRLLPLSLPNLPLRNLPLPTLAVTSSLSRLLIVRSLRHRLRLLAGPRLLPLRNLPLLWKHLRLHYLRLLNLWLLTSWKRPTL